MQLYVLFENHGIDHFLTSMLLLRIDSKWHNKGEGEVCKTIATDPISAALNSFPVCRCPRQYWQGINTQWISHKISTPDKVSLSQELADCLSQILALSRGVALWGFTRKLGCAEVLVCHWQSEAERKQKASHWLFSNLLVAEPISWLKFLIKNKF